jgi:hypothetical protein
MLLHGKFTIGKIEIIYFLVKFRSYSALTVSYVGLLVFLFLTSLSTIFQLYRVGQLYWFRNPEYPEKVTDLSQITDFFIT